MPLSTEILVYFLIALLIIPIGLGALSFLIAIWTRKRKQPTYCEDLMFFMYKLYVTDGKRTDTAWNTTADRGFYIWLVFFFAIPLVSLDILSIMDKEGVHINLLYPLGVIGFLVVPRLFLDLCHSVKYSFKTQKSDDIEELKEQVND